MQGSERWCACDTIESTSFFSGHGYQGIGIGPKGVIVTEHLQAVV